MVTNEAAADLARAGNTDALKALLSQGLSPDTCDEKGNSLLMLAAYHGRTSTVELLLKAGAQPDSRNTKGQTPLGGVAFKGYVEIAQLLLEAGADPRADQGGTTPADLAVTFGRKEILVLLEAHAAQASKPTNWFTRLIARLRGL
jgi:ankyrin repeat protein